MDRLKNLLNICKAFKDGKFNIEEFQSRLGTALLPEPETEAGKIIEPLVYDTIEELEGARFLYGYNRAYELADVLISRIQNLRS